jgi:hypothetical protein
LAEIRKFPADRILQQLGGSGQGFEALKYAIFGVFGCFWIVFPLN